MSKKQLNLFKTAHRLEFKRLLLWDAQFAIHVHAKAERLRDVHPQSGRLL
jgi:hypothetical protein